jgi:hypothetical protein
MKNIFICFLFALASHSVQASDSTLFNKRLTKIKTLSEELAILPMPLFREAADTINLIGLYKHIELKYLAAPFKDPQFNTLVALRYLHELISTDSNMSEFKFQYPDPEKDSVVDVRYLIGYLNNTIICYFRMYNEDWELFYFSFKENSDQLIYLIEAGGEPDWYKRKKYFMDRLYSLKEK